MVSAREAVEGRLGSSVFAGHARDASEISVCDHESMANPAGQQTPYDGSGELVSVPIVWTVSPGPPPLVNQFLLQGQPDADGGPGEIVVHVGYALAPPSPPKGGVPVTTVASFALTRHRAEQLQEFLQEQIDNWDKLDASTRGKERPPR